jgi:HEAT repeat protein
MVEILLLGAVLCAAGPASDSGSNPRAEYDTLRATVGRDPDAHVKLALWCEAHGLEAERVKHLAQAVLIAPDHALARGLLGLVRQGARWAAPDRAKADEALATRLAEYNARREALDGSATAHWQLGVWCQENGLEPEAKAHFTAVTRLKPESTDAWKRLGYVKQNGRWVEPEQAAADAARKKAQLEANARWQPKLETLRAHLTDPKRRAEAESELAAITDPLAIPAVFRVLGNSRPEHQRLAVQILGQIDSPAAAPPLILLLTASTDPEVRRAAGETLARRDVRESIDGLIELVRTPTVYRVVQNGGPGTPKTIEVETQTAKVQRNYAAPRPPGNYWEMLQQDPHLRGFRDDRNAVGPGRALAAMRELTFNSGVMDPDIAAALGAVATAGSPDAAAAIIARGPANPADTAARAQRQLQNQWEVARLEQYANSLMERNLREYNQAVVRTESRFRQDITLIEQGNAVIRRINDRVLPTLEQVSGQHLGDDHAGWTRWWAQEQGYSYEPAPKPVFQQQVPANLPTYTVPRIDCFGAGTPVITLDGPRPIETLQVGDRVLAQHATTGELAYQPVVALVYTERHATLRVKVEGDETPLVVTAIHRFWTPGRGWTMARDLKPGDTLRLVGGTAKVASVESGAVEPVYNVEVAGAHSFFVGPRRLLVHDVTLPEPVSTPFDAPGTLARAAE